MTFKEKYYSIDQSKLPEKAKVYMEEFKKDTKNFTDKEAMKIIMPTLDGFIKKLKESGYESAIKTSKTEKPKKEKVVKKKTAKEMVKEIVEEAVEQPKTTKGQPKMRTIKQGDYMRVAKEIRKEGEPWKDALKRAKEFITTQKEVKKEEAKRQYQKLKEFIEKQPEYYPKDIPTPSGGRRGTTLERDAVRVALPKGKRISKKTGKTYYEYRSNRIDKRRDDYPYLAKGGEVDAIFGDGGMLDRIGDAEKLLKTKKFNTFYEKLGVFKKEYSKNEIAKILTSKKYNSDGGLLFEIEKDQEYIKYGKKPYTYDFDKVCLDSADIDEMKRYLGNWPKATILRWIEKPTSKPREGDMYADGGEMDGNLVVINYGGDRYDGGVVWAIEENGVQIANGIIDGDYGVDFKGKHYDGLLSLAKGINAKLVNKFDSDEYADGGELDINKYAGAGMFAEGGYVDRTILPTGIDNFVYFNTEEDGKIIWNIISATNNSSKSQKARNFLAKNQGKKITLLDGTQVKIDSYGQSSRFILERDLKINNGIVRIWNEFRPKYWYAKGGELEDFYADGGMTKRMIALPVGIKEQIEESISMGYDTLVEGMISPKTRGVMLIDKDSNVRGAYPMLYKGAIEEMLHNIKGYAKGGEVYGNLRKRFEGYTDEELQIFNGDNEETLKNWNREDAIEEAIHSVLEESDEYAKGGELDINKYAGAGMFADGGEMDTTPKKLVDYVKSTPKAKNILKAVYESRIDALKGEMDYYEKGADRYYHEQVRGDVNDEIERISRKMDEVRGDIDFLEDENYPIDLVMSGKSYAISFLNDLNDLIRTKAGRKLFDSSDESSNNEYFDVYNTLYDLVDETFESYKDKGYYKYAKGGKVGDRFSMSKTISDGGQPVEMVIAENVGVKEFDKLFSNKGYRKVYDKSIVGFYFVKPNGDTVQLIPSFHRKGEIIKYAKGGYTANGNLRKRFEGYTDEELQIFNGDNEETLKNWNREDAIEEAIHSVLEESDEYAKGGYTAKGENYEYVNTFGIPQKDFKEMVDAWHKTDSYDQIDRIESRLVFRRMTNKYGKEKVEEINKYIWDTHNAHEHSGEYAKGGEMSDVRIGDILITSTGVKVVVVDYDSMFGGRIKAVRMDEYATGKPSQWMPVNKFKKYAKGGKIGFKGLSDKVAKYYTNKKVPSKYQNLYGKTYDKQEAKEVGDKVASKVYYLQKSKMAKGGEVGNTTHEKVTLIFDGKEHKYDMVFVDGTLEDVLLPYTSMDTPLFNYLEKEFDDWLEYAGRDYEAMYFSDEAIYSKRGAIRGAMDVIEETISDDKGKKKVYNLDKGEVDFMSAFS